MKIKIDDQGNIVVVAVDSKPIAGAIQVANNNDLLESPGKYAFINGTMALKKSLVLSATPLSAKADGLSTIQVTIQARTSAGSSDTAAAYQVVLSVVGDSGFVVESPLIFSASSVALSSGVGSFTVKSSATGTFKIAARSANVWGGQPLSVQFAT